MCEDKQYKKEKDIKSTLSQNRETLKNTLDENEGVVCSYLLNMFTRVFGHQNITPTDGD